MTFWYVVCFQSNARVSVSHSYKHIQVPQDMLVSMRIIWISMSYIWSALIAFNYGHQQISTCELHKKCTAILWKWAREYRQMFTDKNAYDRIFDSNLQLSPFWKHRIIFKQICAHKLCHIYRWPDFFFIYYRCYHMHADSILFPWFYGWLLIVFNAPGFLAFIGKCAYLMNNKLW